MSIAAMNTIWDQSQATGTELLLLLALADHSNDDGVCWPGLTRLAKRCRTTTRSIQRLLVKLEKLGEIHIAHNAGRGRTNMYLLTLERTAAELRPILIKRLGVEADQVDTVIALIHRRQRYNDTHVVIIEKDDTHVVVSQPVNDDTHVAISAENTTPSALNDDIAMSSKPLEPKETEENNTNHQILNRLTVNLNSSYPGLKPILRYARLKLAGDTLYFAAVNRYDTENVDRRFRPHIERLATHAAGRPISLVVSNGEQHDPLVLAVANESAATERTVVTGGTAEHHR